jgi:hypothetical protein
MSSQDSQGHETHQHFKLQLLHEGFNNLLGRKYQVVPEYPFDY